MTMYESDEPCIRTAYRIGYWTGTVFAFVTFVWGLAAGILTYGSSWTPWAIMSLALVQLVVQ